MNNPAAVLPLVRPARVFFALLGVNVFLAAVVVGADAAAETEAEAPDLFGPYEAIVRDRNIVHDVKVDEDGNVFLKLNPEFRNQEIRVRISMQKGAAYRKWFTTGTEDLISPAFAGKEPGGWTDRVQTTANYIEYWMDGRLILHLHKTAS